MKKKDKMERCLTCGNLDQEKSNHNWVVCRGMPLTVIQLSSSKNCEKYIEAKNNGKS